MNLTRVKKCLAAGIPWKYKNGILAFTDGKFKAIVILDNENSSERKEIFYLLNMPADYTNYTSRQLQEAMKELYYNFKPEGDFKARVPAYTKSPSRGLETRSKFIQKYTLVLTTLDAKYIKQHAPKIIDMHDTIIKQEWTCINELEKQQYKLMQMIKKHFSSIIKITRDTGYNIHIEAFIISLKNY